MALPTSRDLTLNPTDPCPSALLNKLQDCVVGQKRPELWSWFAPVGKSESQIAWDFPNGRATVSVAPGSIDLVPITPFVGSRITQIGARVLGTGAAGNVVVRLYKNQGDGTLRTTVATLTIVAPPAAWALYTFPAINHLVVDQMGYSLAIDMPTLNQAVALLGYASDRL